MPSYDVEIEGHKDTFNGYKAMVEIVAATREEAVAKARAMAESGEVDWVRLPEDYRTDDAMQIDSVDIVFDTEEDEDEDDDQV